VQELANMLRYTCIVYLVTAFVQLTNYFELEVFHPEVFVK